MREYCTAQRSCKTTALPRVYISGLTQPPKPGKSPYKLQPHNLSLWTICLCTDHWRCGFADSSVKSAAGCRQCASCGEGRASELLSCYGGSCYVPWYRRQRQRSCISRRSCSFCCTWHAGMRRSQVQPSSDGSRDLHVVSRVASRGRSGLARLANDPAPLRHIEL
jgi:hypothetical protein